MQEINETEKRGATESVDAFVSNTRKRALETDNDDIGLDPASPDL